MLTKTKRGRLLIGIGLSLFLAGGTAGCGKSDASAKELRVFAASSLTDVMEELAEAYTAETGVIVRLNLASSSTLARQIEQGAPADLFLSADEDWMNYVEERNGIRPASRLDLLGNSLVLIEPADEDISVTFSNDFDFAGAFEGRLALGDPSHVPAGKYAKAALKHFGWYEPVAERLLPCANVRDALMVVEHGEVRLGIVYATDAAASAAVKVVGTFPEDSHPPIRYAAALTSVSGPEAEAFYAFLKSTKAAEVFRLHKFFPLAASAPPEKPTE